MTTVYRGSCLCGAVRFEVEGDFEHFYLCHCAYCRKDTGSAHASNLFSGSATLVWRSGRALVSTYTLDGTRHVRSFCSRCGSALPHFEGEEALLAVPAGSLDDPVSRPPDAHIFTASRAEWDHALESVPGVEGLP